MTFLSSYKAAWLVCIYFVRFSTRLWLNVLVNTLVLQQLHLIIVWNQSKWWFINFLFILDFRQFFLLLVSKKIWLRPKTFRNPIDWHSIDRNIINYQYSNVSSIGLQLDCAMQVSYCTISFWDLFSVARWSNVSDISLTWCVFLVKFIFDLSLKSQSRCPSQQNTYTHNSDR